MDTLENTFHGDRPIEVAAEDRLGFGSTANHVAEAIHRMASPDGFVIGIEGAWGSGKSSFINLVIDSLRRTENPPEIVRFLPWLISSREGLLKELFTEITKAALRIDSVEPPATRWKRTLRIIWPDRHSAESTRKKKLKKLFARFSSRLVQAGKVAELFGLVGAGTVAEVGKSSIDEWLSNPSLEGEKASIQKELQLLKRKIVVFIDDLDRLDPDEVVEVLRLVRAVVDFPNIVFVLCYSQEIVAKNLSTALHIADGHAYLEKIVQVSFPIPRPEAFDLRRLFRHELQFLYPHLLNDDGDSTRPMRDRLAQVIDDEGGRALLTPRHVIRAVNALRFHATPVQDSIDIPDMVWLQLVRIQSPKLHQWIESYLIGFAARHAGAMITEENNALDSKKLDSILKELGSTGSSRDARRATLSSTIPGIDFEFEGSGDESRMILTLYGHEDVSTHIRDRRLGSPQHFRYYFALTGPQNSISDREFSLFLESAESSREVAMAHFAELATSPMPQGGFRSQALLDRLKGDGIESASEAALPGILDALTESMDAAALATGPGDWGEYWVWRDAESVLAAIWRKLKVDERSRSVKRMFGAGKSIGWMTEIFRGEVFSHGIHGNNKKPESEWLLSSTELEIAATELLRRYREISPSDLDLLPRIAPLLYAWMQYKHDSLNEIKAKVDQICQKDEDFLTFLHKMRGWQATNGVVRYPLRESNLSPFTDIDKVRSRLNHLTVSADTALSQRARALEEALVADEREWAS